MTVAGMERRVIMSNSKTSITETLKSLANSAESPKASARMLPESVTSPVRMRKFWARVKPPSTSFVSKPEKSVSAPTSSENAPAFPPRPARPTNTLAGSLMSSPTEPAVLGALNRTLPASPPGRLVFVGRSKLHRNNVAIIPHASHFASTRVVSVKETFVEILLHLAS